MPEVVNEGRRVPVPSVFDLIRGIQQVVTVNASVRVNEMDGVALFIVGWLEYVGAVSHVIKLVDELEAPLKERIKIRGEDRAAERCSPVPGLLRFQDAGKEDM